MPYDPSVLAEHCDADPALVRRVISLFLAEHEAQLGDLRTAVERRDLDRLFSLAHSIKGAAATFGARDAIDAARAVETCCRDRRIEEAATRAAELEGAIRALAQALRAAAPA